MGGRRRKIPDEERFKVWVRAGGRCVICNRYLLEGELGFKELTFGQLAHIVGQQESENSPRGLDDDLDEDGRDLADNIVLVCDDEHDELDKRGSRGDFSVELLRTMKREHEERIDHVTGLVGDRRTTVLRVVGLLRGNAVEVDRDAVVAAVIGSTRFPLFPFAARNQIEIDLRHVAGEASGNEAYYRSATAIIDEVVDNVLHDAVAKDVVNHLSVFAFARLPLLIYLGSKLGDDVPTDLYQRHRATETWGWQDMAADASFTVVTPGAAPEADEGVLVMNVSGTIQAEELPEELASLPRFELVVDGAAEPDVFRGPAAVASFTAACRHLLADIERTNKQMRLLHVFAALPLTAGVAFGRVFDPSVHPSVLVYDRTDNGYRPALQVGAR